MTSPAKPPAPMEPCSHFAFEPGCDGYRCKSCGARMQDVPGTVAHKHASESANRRAAPAPTDGEVGRAEAIYSALSKLDSQIVRHEAGTCEGGALPAAYSSIVKQAREELAALSRQSAELAEAKQGKLAADLRADGWKALSEQTAAELAEARERIADAAEVANRAESALLALGCKPGPDGWMRPCECGTRGCETFHPIPGAGAKGETK